MTKLTVAMRFRLLPGIEGTEAVAEGAAAKVSRVVEMGDIGGIPLCAAGDVSKAVEIFGVLPR